MTISPLLFNCILMFLPTFQRRKIIPGLGVAMCGGLGSGHFCLLPLYPVPAAEMVEVSESQLLSCLSSHLVHSVKCTRKAGFVIRYCTPACMNREVTVFAFASELQGHNINTRTSGSAGTYCTPIKTRCCNLTQTIVMY